MKVIVIDTKSERADKRSAELFERYFKEETGLDVRYDELSRNDMGKPEAVDGFYFNISHSKNYWCLGVHDSEIGVDIEKKRPINERMGRRVLAPGEEALEGDLLNTWVIKEAYAKMLGSGLRLDFRSISVDEITKRCHLVDYSTKDYICFAIYRDKNK